MKTSPRHKVAGFTLVEMMTSVGCSTFILAAIVIAGVALQRSFAAVEGYARTEADQLRVLDYVSMDCRRAITASVSGNVLTLTLPPYYNINGALTTPNTPTNSSGTLTYGSGTVTVKYSQTGSNFNREVIITGTTSSDSTTAIATNVSAFTVTAQDLTSTVACSIMFFPTFLRSPGTGAWTSGTAAPGAGTPGANGDWYVITPLQDGSNASSVGNVYFKSSGSYALQQNVKATQVYCNTFLRNAAARQ